MSYKAVFQNTVSLTSLLVKVFYKVFSKTRSYYSNVKLLDTLQEKPARYLFKKYIPMCLKYSERSHSVIRETHSR